MAGEDKIDFSGWQEMRARVKAAASRRARVKVGVLSSAGQHGGIHMADLAAVHELGSGPIPERSFIRRTLDLRSADINKFTARVAGAFVEDTMDLDDALGLLGQFVVAAIRRTITTEQVVPRLDESEAGRRTIARKGSSVTLVDTAQLLNAISYEVEGAAMSSSSSADEPAPPSTEMEP